MVIELKTGLTKQTKSKAGAMWKQQKQQINKTLLVRLDAS